MDFLGQTIFCFRCRKSWTFRKWRFGSFALLCSMRNQPFLSEKWISTKIYGFWKKFFAQNGAKIILNKIQGTKMVFYYRIQELVNPPNWPYSYYFSQTVSDLPKRKLHSRKPSKSTNPLIALFTYKLPASWAALNARLNGIKN